MDPSDNASEGVITASAKIDLLYTQSLHPELAPFPRRRLPN